MSFGDNDHVIGITNCFQNMKAGMKIGLFYVYNTKNGYELYPQNVQLLFNIWNSQLPFKKYTMDIKDVNTMGAKFSQYEVLIPQRSFLNVYDIQIGLGYCV